MAKNFTKIVTVLILSFLSFHSCRQEVGINKDQNPSRAEEFFKNRNERSKTVNPTFVSGLINRLERINKSRDFLSSLSDKSGLPIWNYAIEARVKKYDRFTQRDGDIEEMIIIPLKKNSNYLSSLMYVENPKSDSPKIYTVTNAQLKTFVYNQNIDRTIRERVLMTFIYFDNTVFGRKAYGEIPLDLFTNVFSSAGAEKKSFEIEKVDTSPTSRVEEICYTLLHCKNGVNESQCDHCSLCETFFCLIFGGGPVDDGNDGNDGGTGDNNGDGNYGGGGDGSGSGGGNPDNSDPCSDPSSPWYTHHSCGNNTNSGSTSADPSCNVTKPKINSATTKLKNQQVQTNMDAVLKAKVQAPIEYGLKIGENSDGSFSFSNLVQGTATSTPLTNATLPSGNYIADGHSHAGGQGDPSAGDLYGMLEQLTVNNSFQIRFVYGDYFGSPEVYALVLHDFSQAATFLSQYPKSQNYNEQTHSFIDGSVIGTDYFIANQYSVQGTYTNGTNENYNHGAVAMAYILAKFNSGIILAKVDADGNLKKVNVSKEEIVVPGGDGTPKQGLKITKCP